MMIIDEFPSYLLGHFLSFAVVHADLVLLLLIHFSFSLVYLPKPKT
jgi:hypothetical protein